MRVLSIPTPPVVFTVPEGIRQDQTDAVTLNRVRASAFAGFQQP